MKVFRNIPFVFFMYGQLPLLKEIDRKRESAKRAGDFEEERKQILEATSMWGKNVVDKFGVDLRVSGRDNVPEGAVLFVGNHQGYGDIPLTCAAITNKQFGFIAKEQLSKIPKYGKWMSNIRSLFIKRDDARASLRTVEKGIEYIKQGFSLIIYPEGTRAKGPVPGEFKKGTLRLATKPGVPIVPVTMSGSYHVFEEKGMIQKNQRVDIVIHPPIQTAGISRKEESALYEKVENIIVGKLMELNLEKGEISEKEYKEYLRKKEQEKD